jgi:molybdenum cofactor cytidylyltransferase
MHFDRFHCDAAEGVILAHTIRTPRETFKKGRMLSASDLSELRKNGIEEVAGVRLEADDVDENQAALELAQALAGPQLEFGKPVAGRCNLYAKLDGLAQIAPEVIDRINLCDTGILIATLSVNAECVQQQAVASIKVIPFALSRDQLDVVLALASASAPAVGLLPFQPHSVALILTETPGLKESVLKSTSRVTTERVTAMGGQILFEARCRHTVQALSSAISSALEKQPDMLLICGSSITVDPADIVPSAIISCGGVVDHFGMPVEPGNMLLLAHIGACQVINMPGCSRSPKLNGLDWVLQRMAAGQDIGKAEILSMGVGGLVKDISHRMRMREQGDLLDNVQSPQRVAAIVLGAGRSSRMGEANKLLLTIGGIPIVQRVVDAALKADLCAVTVVTGHQFEEVQNMLGGRSVNFVHNSNYRDGISASLKLGLSSLPPDIDGVMILLADMPLITATHINELIAEFNPALERDIVAPIREGRLGNPVIWSARYIPDMMRLGGDRGARPLLEEFAANVWEVPMGDDAVFLDVDTPAALDEANAVWQNTVGQSHD